MPSASHRHLPLRRGAPLALAVILGLLLSLISLDLTAGQQFALPTPTATAAGPEVIGLASSAVECLAAEGGAALTAGLVNLTWEGVPDRARLMLRVAGSEAPHTVWLNGQPVAQVPVVPSGEPCWGETFYFDVPLDALVQGDNRVAISSDQMAGDAWTAAQVRLEVSGRLSLPRAASGGLASSAASSFTAFFTNGLDGTTQAAWVQVPAGYASGVPTALVVYAHSRSSSMFEPLDPDSGLAAAVDAQGWLLVSPEMHGHWPGTAAVPTPDPPGKYAYASLESQYDLIGALSYMVAHYTVKPDQIYLVGPSMGGQMTSLMGAKYADVFAGVVDVKGPTDMAQWYGESETFHQDWMERECYTGSLSNPTPQPPSGNRFCYDRRSSQSFVSNYLHVPISISHSLSDTLVPIAHSFQLRDQINALEPDDPVTVYIDRVIGPACGPPYHCYLPPADDIIAYLEPLRLNLSPARANVTTDESKSYYWLNVQQTGGDHWTSVDAAANRDEQTVSLVVSDTRQLILGLNLGIQALPGVAGLSQPGLGLDPGLYQLTGGGLNEQYLYTSGYLTFQVPITGLVNLLLAPAQTSTPTPTRTATPTRTLTPAPSPTPSLTPTKTSTPSSWVHIPLVTK